MGIMKSQLIEDRQDAGSLFSNARAQCVLDFLPFELKTL